MADFFDTALRWLLSRAKAIEDGNLESANEILQNILILADGRPYRFRNQSRVMKYFAEALVRRAYGLHPASSYFTFPVDPARYYHYNSYGINAVIRNVIKNALMEKNALMGNRRLHLIDFSIPHYNYSFEGSVLSTLPNFSRDPLSVRVSYILPPFLKNHVKLSREMEFLIKDAKGLNVKLEDELKLVYANSLAEVDKSELDFKRSTDDEIVVVYYKFKLHKLLRDGKAMERELVRLKEINPTIVITLDFYSNHSHSKFLTYLEDSFQYSSNTCKCWWGLDLYLEQQYPWECNRDASEGNNLIRRHQTLSEWQRLFSMAGFTRIPLIHKEYILEVKDQNFLEIMEEKEECLILGYKECPLFFLSAWKPKAEDGHFNFSSTNHKFRQGFNPNPSTLQPLQPFLEGLALNRLVALPEIYDMLKDLCCKYERPLALTWASKVNNMNETTSDLNKKHSFLIQSSSCYVNDWKSYRFMDVCEQHFASLFIDTEQLFARKALESRDGYHFESSITKQRDFPYPIRVEEYNIDVVVAICLQNRYTTNDVYVVEFYWPATESKISKSLALHIFNDLKHMKAKFVTLKIQCTEIGFLEETVSNILTLSNKAVEEARDVYAVERNGVNVERGVVSNFPSPMHVHSSSKVVAAPFNTLEGPHYQIFPNADPEIGKANKEKLVRTKQRKLRSKVWVDFDKIEVNGEQVAKCKHCHKECTGSSKSGTSHLKNHLDRCQEKKKQNQERQLISRADTNERNSTFDKKRSHMDLAKMMIKLQCSLDMAEQETFTNFVKGLQPMFEFQSKDTLSYIHCIYKEEKEKLQLHFDLFACKFNLTVSLWKNNSGKTTYCCLIAHFIDDGWKLKRKILGLKTLEHINDTKALGEIILSLVLEWNISNKVCSITVDNSFLNDSMVDQIKENCLSDQGSLSSDHWFINCTLLEDGFRQMDDLLFKLKKSIEYVTETRHGKLKFQEAVDQVKLQGGKSWDDLSFRLESDFDILDSALRSREIFCQLEQIDGNFKLNPSMEEWENAVALRSCLKCFDDIKGTQFLPVSLYFPKLCDTYKKFLQLEKSSHSFVTLMKRKFDHYWSLCNLPLAVASVLDPRLKFKIVELSYRVIYGHDSKMRLNMFHKVLRDVYYEYASEAKNLTTSASVLDDFNFSTTGLGNDSILDSLSKYASASNFNEEASWKLELELYLDEPLLPMDGAFFDILGWWCDKSQRFPILAKMAQNFLAIPVSISTSCSNISAMINNPAYSSLNPESMEALVCSENWLETPKENDGENHEPMQITDKGKRKMDEEDSYPVKNSKPSNCEKVNSTEDIAKDSNNNDFSLSFDNWMELQFSSSEYIGEKAEIMKALVCNENRLESSMGKPNHEKNIDDVTEILNYDPLFNIYQLDEVQSSSSESEDDTTLKEEGPWCEQDIKAYLLSRFTSKEHKRLDKWQRNELNGKLIGRDKKFKFQGEILAPLLMMPQSDETRKKYYINDSVVNAFFELLKKRSDTFPNTYINHYSFDSQIAAQLIQGSRSEHEVLIWFKAEKLRGVHILFLPLCLSSHWVLLYVDIKEKKFSLLDPDPSSLILSYHLENHVKVLLQWFTSFLLPKHGYSDANKWPFIVRNDIPKQKNLVDCGIFVMKYGDCLTHGDCFPFKQEDMVHFRRRIFLDIYRGRLYRKKNKQ